MEDGRCRGPSWTNREFLLRGYETRRSETVPQIIHTSKVSVEFALRILVLGYTHWLGVPGGERVGKLRVSSLSSDTEFLLTASQSVTPISFLARGLLGDLGEQEAIIAPCRGNGRLTNTERSE